VCYEVSHVPATAQAAGSAAQRTPHAYHDGGAVVRCAANDTSQALTLGGTRRCGMVISACWGYIRLVTGIPPRLMAKEAAPEWCHTGDETILAMPSLSTCGASLNNSNASPACGCTSTG